MIKYVCFIAKKSDSGRSETLLEYKHEGKSHDFCEYAVLKLIPRTLDLYSMIIYTKAVCHNNHMP